MNITVLSIGKTKEAYLKEGADIYTKRLSRYVNFTWKELPDVRNSNKLDRETLKMREAELFLSHIQPADVMVLLDENGKDFDSVTFSKFIESKMVSSVRHLVFVVGGAYGFGEAMRQRANHKLRLSSMTFSHQIIRLIFLEQIYRAFTIIRGEPYHNP